MGYPAGVTRWLSWVVTIAAALVLGGGAFLFLMNQVPELSGGKSPAPPPAEPVKSVAPAPPPSMAPQPNRPADDDRRLEEARRQADEDLRKLLQAREERERRVQEEAVARQRADQERRIEEERRRATESAARQPKPPPPMSPPPAPPEARRAEAESARPDIERQTREAERRRLAEAARRLEEERRRHEARPEPYGSTVERDSPRQPTQNTTTSSSKPPTSPVPTSAPTAEALPDFKPWPPPTPSARSEIDRRMIAPDGATPTLRAVANRIEAALKRAHYEYSFYGVPGGGFAVVARLERIDDDGAAMPGGKRFLPPDAKEPFDLSRYVSELFFAPAGYYRMIALVVTDQPLVTGGVQLAEADARKMALSGATELPRSFAGQPFGPHHRLYALVYEYRKGAQARDVQMLVPGRLPARTHLSRSGVETALESNR